MSTKIDRNKEDLTDEEIVYLEMRGKLPKAARTKLGKQGRKNLAAVLTGDLSLDDSPLSGKASDSEEEDEGGEAEEPTKKNRKKMSNDDLRTEILEKSEQLGVEPNLDGNKKALISTLQLLDERLNDEEQ